MPIRSKPLIASALLAGCVCSAQAACPPAGRDANALQRLLGAKFEGLETGPRDALARGLLDCLADPRPELRDAIAFEALAAWMRAGALSSDALPFLRRELSERPIAYIAKRTTGPGDVAYWERWLGALAAPAPLPSWDAAFKSQSGLARRHNAQAFMQVLYVMVRESGDATLQQRLLPGLVAALK